MKKIIHFSIIGLLIASFAFFGFNYFLPGDMPILQNLQLECKSPIAIYEDNSRLPLRKFVSGKMGDLHGKKVMDIGAGPGFFAFEMAKSAEYVYATELDPSFLKYMEKKKAEMGMDNFEVIAAKEDHSELTKLNADYALLVYVFHYIENPKLFLNKLIHSLSPEGKLFVVNSQISPVIIKDYLTLAGFTEIEQSEFFYTPTEDCGPVEVQLISATRPPASLADLK